MIESVRNSQIQKVRKLLRRAARDESRQFLVEGAIAVSEALEAGAPIRCLLVEQGAGAMQNGGLRKARMDALRVTEVSPQVMKAISATSTAAGVVAVSDFVDTPPERLLGRPLSLVAVLAQVRDPGNAGTILRSCRAAGVDAVFVATGSVDIYNPKLVRASAAALFSLPVARDVDVPWVLDELGRRGFRRIAADPRGQVVYDRVDMTGPTALVFGNEAWGLPAHLKDLVDVRASIPMAGSYDSLNVAISAAVFLFEAARQRRAGGPA